MLSTDLCLEHAVQRAVVVQHEVHSPIRNRFGIGEDAGSVLYTCTWRHALWCSEDNTRHTSHCFMNQMCLLRKTDAPHI